ncbi:SpoIIE family protein phosphatase [Desulfobacterales bacterium HSG2]|nr:SpoIIE family protein phosphatase [Desulfobacterales bacterium HSG2]
MSLRTKLLVFSIILALIPVVIVGTRMIQITKDELKSSANEHLSAVASRVAQEIDNSTQLGPLRLIRKAVENKNLGGKEKLSLLTEVIKNVTDIVAVQISVEGYSSPMLVTQVEFSNHLRASSLMPKETLELKPERIAALLKKEDLFAGDVVYLPEADAWLLTIILRLDEDKFGYPATLSARINLGSLRQSIEKDEQTHKIFITLIDPESRQIFDPDRTDISGRKLVRTTIGLLASDTRISGVEPYTRPSGDKMLGAYDFPTSLNWGINVEKNDADAYMAVNKMVRDWYYSIIAGFSFAVIAAIFVSVSLTGPLRRLTQAAHRISGGDLSFRIEGKEKKDEIGQLSQTFNKMLGDLRQYMTDLEETTKAKERVESELNLAKEIQESFLPKTFPELERIDIWGKCDPAREVGGDYFDFFQLDDKNYGMVIGDVSGKGVAAALFMAVSRTLFRILSAQELSPDRVLTEFNDRLVALDQGANMFITLFYGVFNLDTGRLLYSTAGHNMPYIRSSRNGEGGFQMLPPVEQTMVAGIMDGMTMGSAETLLHSGDAIILYTDGMTEAVDDKEEEFGEDRLEELLNTYISLSAKDMCEKLIEDVKLFQTGMPQFDDMTMFILKVR